MHSRHNLNNDFREVVDLGCESAIFRNAWHYVEIAAGAITRVLPNGRKQTIAKPGGGPNGAAIGPELFSFFRSIGINLKQLYGQTETCAYV